MKMGPVGVLETLLPGVKAQKTEYFDDQVLKRFI
jgi:hypothetical protein